MGARVKEAPLLAMINILDAIVVHIQSTKSPREAWDNLIKDFAVNTKARRMQLKNELHTIEKRWMTVNDYALTIKIICEMIASIDVAVDDQDRAEVCLNGLGPQYKSFKMSILTRENAPTMSQCLSLKNGT